MINALPFLLAVSHPPLFGNQWLALLAALGGVVVFMGLIWLAGRWLAATHPVSPTVAKTAAEVEVALAPTSETLAIIAAAVAAHLGAQARITSIRPGGPSVEMLMQQWSLEGRRQIYSSHQVR